MIEIQCTSCQTRYRIDERILPEDTPTFKCSRCGHVFSAEPRQKQPPRASAGSAPRAEAAQSSPRTAAESPQQPAASAAEEPVSPQPRQEPPHAADAAVAAADAQPRVSRPRQQAGAAGRRASAQPPPAAAAPQAQPEEPSPDQPGTQDLLERRFRDIPGDEADKPGENLAFDFNDEPLTPDSTSQRSYAEEKWEVGDTDVAPSPPPRPKPRIRISDIDDDLEGDQRPEKALSREPIPNQDAEQDFERIRPEEVSAQAHSLEAELRGRSYKLHSAGYFIGLFALVIFGFGMATIVIQSAPLASAGLLSALPIVGEGLAPPISPARRVALVQVQAQYASLKGNQTALVISGTAENLTSSPLGVVQVEAALTASGPEPLRRQAVYCGNSLSSKMLDEMTPHEIEFFEKLDAPKSFTLAPQASAPFMIVFIAPPAGAGHFQLRVVRADSAAAPAPATEGG
ncbi:MAG TPA: DUF3426 domain-containing protein [Candidatus Binataceae bacterium]|nr:DUF3426 domain-containing protein [Candidatus Binataceae bacterium]